MRRSKKSELLHRLEQFVADQLRLIQRPRMNHFEAHRADLGKILERLALPGYRRNACADCIWIIGALAAPLADPPDTTFRQNRLAGHVQ